MSKDFAGLRRKLDRGGMLDAIQSFPQHLRDGWVAAADLVPEHRVRDLQHVVVLGMGGSAIGGDLLRAYTRSVSPVPITVVRDYSVPPWVGPGTLVIASSYSGSTEETLSALADATERDAAVYAVTSGGTLLAHAQENDLPHILLPGGMQPRAALGYSFAALLRIADKVGLAEINDDIFERTIEALERASQSLSDPESSLASEIADQLVARLAIVYTGPGLLEPVGLRWRNQIQENAKQMAYGSVFAELNHNEIMGWERAASPLRSRTAVVVLRDPDDHPQIQKRMDATRDLISDRPAVWREVLAEGEAPLTRMLTTLQLGDFVSYFMALRGGVDPTPVDTIQDLKRTLAEG